MSTSQYLLLLLSAISFQLTSILQALNVIDLNEIDNFKYNLEILSVPKLIDATFDSQNHGDSVVLLTSIHGQTYECNLTNTANRLNEYEKTLDVNNQKAFNFTYISDELNKTLLHLKNLDQCLYKTQGWWTYEFCFNRNITQYHLLANGSIAEPIITLGTYNSDWNWLDGKESDMLKHDGKYYHEQYYESGTPCELSGQPRRTTVKFYCDEKVSNNIEAISETETCIYTIHLYTSLICPIPGFEKKAKISKIQCSPVLSKEDYQKYLEKKRLGEEEEERELQAENIRKKSEIDKQLNLFEENTEANYVAEDLEPIEENTKADSEVAEEVDSKIQIDNKVLKTEVSDFARKINGLLKNIDDMPADDEQMDEMTDANDESVDNDNSLSETISHKLSDFLDNLSLEDDLADQTATSPIDDQETEDKKKKENYEIKVSVLETQTLDDEHKGNTIQSTKRLEERIKEELVKKNKKYEKIEIKVVSFDNRAVLDDVLNDESASVMKTFFDSMLASRLDSKKFKELKNNYNLVFSDGNLQKGANKGDQSDKNHDDPEKKDDSFVIRF